MIIVLLLSENDRMKLTHHSQILLKCRGSTGFLNDLSRCGKRIIILLYDHILLVFVQGMVKAKK